MRKIERKNSDKYSNQKEPMRRKKTKLTRDSSKETIHNCERLTSVHNDLSLDEILKINESKQQLMEEIDRLYDENTNRNTVDKEFIQSDKKSIEMNLNENEQLLECLHKFLKMSEQSIEMNLVNDYLLSDGKFDGITLQLGKENQTILKRIVATFSENDFKKCNETVDDFLNTCTNILRQYATRKTHSNLII